MKTKNISSLRLFAIIFSVIGIFFIFLFLSPYWNMPVHPKSDASDIEKKAVDEYLNGNYTGAIYYYTKAYLDEKDGARRCSFLRSLGDIYIKIGDEEKAKEYYKNASDAAEANKYMECLSDVMLSEWKLTGNPEYLKNASEIAESQNDKQRMFYSYSYLANYFYRISEYANATEAYKSALRYKESGDNVTAGYDYAGLGSLYANSNDSKSAIENFMVAEKIFEDARDKDALLDLYMRWGYVYVGLKDIKNAEIYYEKAVTISSELNKNTDNISLMKAEIYSVEAYMNMNEGKYNDALDSANKCIEVYNKFDPKKSSHCYVVLCYIYFQSKDYENALQCYENLDTESLGEGEKFNVYFASAELYLYLAQVYKGREVEVRIINGEPVEFDKAAEWLDKAIESYEKAKETGEKINMDVSMIPEKISNAIKAKEDYEKN